MTHNDPKVDESFIGVLHEEYQSIFEDGYGTMQVNCGNIHKYLGMKLDFSTVGQVKITMLAYIDEIIDAFDKSDPTGGGNKSISALDIIFKAKEDCKKA